MTLQEMTKVQISRKLRLQITREIFEEHQRGRHSHPYNVFEVWLYKQQVKEQIKGRKGAK